MRLDLDIPRMRTIVEQAGFTLEEPTKDHVYTCHILSGGKTVGRLSIFVLDELTELDMERVLGKIRLEGQP